MKLLKKKLLFALFSDQPGQNFEYHNYDFLYLRSSEFDKSSVREAAGDLVSSGFVDKLTRNRRSWFRLTTLGREIILKKLNLMPTREPWDRHWRIVTVNKIGASLRPLQRELYKLGFKRFSRGVYLVPANVSEAAKEVLLKGKWLNQATLIESRRLVSGDERQLARNLWHLEKIGDKYVQFVTQAERLLKQSRVNLVLLQQAKFGFKTVFDSYYRLVSLDPGLPKALLPPDWKQEEARSIFYRLVELAKTAKI